MARPKLYPCLWFDGKAEEAASFYTSLLPNSSVDKVWRSPADTPSGPAGMVLVVDFTVGGQQFQALNGGPDFQFNEAVSFVIECDDQAEVDRLWDTLIADGGEPGPCGWLKDRFGVSWQIVPKALNEMGRRRPGRRSPGHGSHAPDGQVRGRAAAGSLRGSGGDGLGALKRACPGVTWRPRRAAGG
jgi:predicted 3-demethylubiquinone-9 3-methyltransferase (glyoxalase superfamily)